MSAFLVVRILQSQSVYISHTLVYSNVELRGPSADTSEESSFFESVAKNIYLDYNHYKLCARITTIVNSSNVIDALNIADNRFSEVMDVISINFPISNFNLSPIGLLKDLDSGAIHHLNDNSFKPSATFMLQQGLIQKYDNDHYLLSRDNELSKRYLRSLHWFRNAKHENNKQLKILFYWFALEALLKESESDNISGIIRWFLGFPNGKNSQDVSLHLIKDLGLHVKYHFWKRKLPIVLDKIREFRNNSVHHGFRNIEFDLSELDLFCQVMVLSVSRCQGAVRNAINNNITSISEFKEYIPEIFELNTHVKNDTHGTIIYSLEEKVQ
ncbi:hypothetical protein ACJWU3_08365 [Klebsiella pneumoniae]